jgi:non-specific serine/threonine protein kinase
MALLADSPANGATGFPRMQPDDDGAKLLFRHRFGTVEFDEARFELIVGGLAVEAQHKPLQLLALLLRRPGEVVEKDEIVAALWNGRATPDQVIATTASRLRAALGEDNAQRIVTVPRKGYRVDPPVERMTVGRRLMSALALEPGAPVPKRESYLLVRQLGRSGAQETWLARQPRSGDLRVYKFALDGERLADLKREVTLFRLLRESLGDDAAIVRVLDWNFEQPPYWLECEPAGRSLAEWVDEPAGRGTRLSEATRAQRLALFGRIAGAVAAAHGVGVLHKDLKPANVLLADSAEGPDRLPIVRLGDFGSGRLLEPQRLEALQITRLGMTVSGDDATSGTPMYIAPELLRGEPATVRCDVYALGVMLFQLVTGDLRRPLAPGWEREVEDEMLVADIAAATDLDPQRRLGTAAELAQRLATLEVRAAEAAERRAAEARAADAKQALLRARARRPWVLGAFLALAAGGAASVVMYVGERRTAAALARQVEVSQALNRVLREDLVGAANPGRGGRADITVADALAVAANRVEARFGELAPAVRGSVHASMQQALADLSRAKEAVQAGRRAVAALAQAEGGDRAALQNARLRLALDLVQLSELDEARRVVQAIEADAGTPDPASPAFRARLLYVKSWLTSGDLSLQASLNELRQAWAIAESMTEEQVPGRDAIAFALADNLALVGSLTDAEALYRRLHAEQVSRHGAGHARPLYTLVGLGRSLALQGRHAEARALLQQAAEGLSRALGARHRQTLTALDQLAEIRLKEGDAAGAADDWARVHDGFAALLGEGSSYAITVRTNLASAQQRAGKAGEAEASLRRALALARAIPLADDAPQVQQIRYALATVLLDAGRRSEAATLLAGLQPESLNLAEQAPDWPDRLERARARTAAR